MAQSSQLGLSRQQVKNLRFRDLYLSGSTIDLGGTKISRDAASGGITIASASGGTVDSRVKNLFADGTITASNLNIIGDYVTMQTTTSNTEQMVIENAGTGPALKVTQTGVNSIAEFYDDGGVLALKIADGGNVGIGTSAPLQKLDVIGTVQATGFSGSGALVTSLNVDNVSLGSLAVARGGTNIQSYTVGDLIYATGDTALSKLADVATGNALISGGVGAIPEWGKIGLTTHVSGTLGVANGGTGVATLTANKVLVGNGTTAVLQPTNLHWDDTNSRLGIGTTNPTQKFDVQGNINMFGTFFQNSIPSQFFRNIDIQTDTTGRSFTPTYADGSIWTSRTYRPYSKLLVYVYVPCRNDAAGWGGMFTSVHYNINSVGWFSLGESGYTTVMNQSGDDIGYYTNMFYLPLSIATTFTCQFKYQHRAYDGTAYVVTSTAVQPGSTNSYGVDINQFYTKIIIVEISN